MECNEMQDLIGPYVDGELDLVRNLEIEDHLQGCSICSRAYENLKALRVAMSASSLYFKPSPDLQKRVQAGLRKAAKPDAKPRVLWWRWALVAVPLVAVAIAVSIIITVQKRPSADDLLAQEALSSHVRSLMVEGHKVDV